MRDECKGCRALEGELRKAKARVMTLEETARISRERQAKRRELERVSGERASIQWLRQRVSRLEMARIGTRAKDMTCEELALRELLGIRLAEVESDA